MLLLVLSLLLSPVPAQAGVWACPQPDGKQVYRDHPTDRHCWLLKKESSPGGDPSPDFQELARRARNAAALSEREDHSAQDASDFEELARRAQAAREMAERDAASNVPDPSSTAVPSQPHKTIGGIEWAGLLYIVLLGLMVGALWKLGPWTPLAFFSALMLGLVAGYPLYMIAAFLLFEPQMGDLTVGLLYFGGAGVCAWLALTGARSALRVCRRGLIIWMVGYSGLALLAARAGNQGIIERAGVMIVLSFIFYGLSLLIAREWGSDKR